MENIYIGIIAGKAYTTNNATKLYILDTALDLGVKEDIVKFFTEFVYELYLKDSNDTPLGKLIDYCYEYWDEIPRKKGIHEILDAFYLTL